MAKAHALVVHRSLISWIISKVCLPISVVCWCLHSADIWPLTDDWNWVLWSLFYQPRKSYTIPYLYNSRVAENILFGDPLDDAFNAGNLPQNEILNEVLAEAAFKKKITAAAPDAISFCQMSN